MDRGPVAAPRSPPRSRAPTPTSTSARAALAWPASSTPTWSRARISTARRARRRAPARQRSAASAARAARTALRDTSSRSRASRGNRDDYYDPRNSCLNDVLDRRLGIPITLCLVLIEVGRRVGLAIEGIGPARPLRRRRLAWTTTRPARSVRRRRRPDAGGVRDARRARGGPARRAHRRAFVAGDASRQFLTRMLTTSRASTGGGRTGPRAWQ